MKFRVRGVADSNNRARVKSGFRDKIVMWWGWVRGSAEWACVDNCPLKFTSRTFLFHFVRGGRKDARGAAGSSPGNDVVGAASGSKKLRVSGRYVNFYAIVEGKSLRGAMLIQTFLCCVGHEGLVRCSKSMECVDGGTTSVDECIR